MDNKDLAKNNDGMTTFVSEIRHIIDEARAHAVRSIDHARVVMYWSIGKRIFEKEQEGKDRADYGKYLIRNLSEKLMPNYGSGFSVRQWKDADNSIGFIQLRPHCGRN